MPRIRGSGANSRELEEEEEERKEKQIKEEAGKEKSNRYKDYFSFDVRRHRSIRMSGKSMIREIEELYGNSSLLAEARGR